MHEHKISILIPSWNGEQYIENCICAILENGYDNYQIISIAGGNDKGYELSVELKNKHPNKIIVLRQEKGNKNKALNQGLERLNGEIIVIIDVDCICRKDWLKNINQIFQDPNINAITGLNLPYQHHKNSLAEFNRIRVGYKLVSFPDKGIVKGNKLWGGNSAFRKETFLSKIGKFETESKTGDDKILGIELNRKGEDLYFFRNIYVYTEHYSDNLRKFIDHRVRWARDLFINYSKIDFLRFLISFGLGLFRFLYVPVILLFWGIFLNTSYLWLLLLISPWLIVFGLYLVRFYFELLFKNNRVKKELNIEFSHFKAFKIVPIIFFAFGLISIRSIFKLKNKKWYRTK